MATASAGSVAVVFVALYVAHQVADHWVQSQHQADCKGEAGWRGRVACASHVATYTVTALLALVAVAWRTGVDLSPGSVAAGLAVSAVTHYIADRRTPLRVLADRAGAGRFYRLNAAGMNGAYLLDQSWHIGWLGVAALVIGGA